MATFHPFPRLPPELRAQIWRLTVEPRIVDLEFKVSSTPVPAILQTCHEARNMGLYERQFTADGVAILPTVAQTMASLPELRYVWLNFDIDMLSVGKTALSCYLCIAPRIKRLRLKRSSHYITECHELQEFFGNVEELQIVCQDSLSNWARMMQNYIWSCEHWLFIDGRDGREVRRDDLDTILAWEERDAVRFRVEDV